MIDTHCHIDLYPDPSKLILNIERDKILTILVTNLPSSFNKAFPHVQGLRFIRLGLGLHPLSAQQHVAERRLFEKYVDRTSYIGEIGLDFSKAGISSKGLQLESFKFVIKCIRNKPKFITLHSRRAESTVLAILEEEKRSPVVFHWYSGPLNVLDRAVSLGHYFSINPAMVKSSTGKKIIERLTKDRILTESDGPFIKIGKRAVVPKDVLLVYKYLAILWNQTVEEVSKIIRENFFKIIDPLRVK